MSKSGLKLTIGPNGELYKPTIKSSTSFNATSDCEALKKAMKGIGTDEDAITSIIGRRTGEERIQIAAEYKSLFGQDLIKELQSELGGKYEDLVIACMRSSTKHLAYSLYKAIRGAGTDETTLCQILACCTNEEIEAIKDEYQTVLIEHKCDPNTRNLEKDIQGDCAGDFCNVLVALIQGDRNEPTEAQMRDAQVKGYTVLVDRALAKNQAQELFNSGEGKMGTDESTFMRLLVKNSVWQIAAIDLAYRELTSNGLIDAIKNELGGTFKEVMLLVVEAALDRPGTYAKLLKKSMKGAGTDDAALIRLVVSRSDIDMGSIKEAYEQLYGVSLADDIKADTSGDYRKMLLTLIDAV